MNEKVKFELHKKFSKIFLAKKDKAEEIADDKKVMYMNSSNTIGIIPKRHWLDDFLRNNFDVRANKVPDLNYKAEKNEIIQSVYSGELLKPIADICRHYPSVILKVKRNYPMTVETEDFMVIIAPRVEK